VKGVKLRELENGNSRSKAGHDLATEQWRVEGWKSIVEEYRGRVSKAQAHNRKGQVF
jgi:hypothetical protein